MGTIKIPQAVQYFASIIFKEKNHLVDAKDNILQLVGNIQEETTTMPFSKTDYYEREMGSDLIRIFVLFETLMQRDVLSDIKIITNDIETLLAKNDARTVNIDPGYMSLENIVLATPKGYAHRIYIGKGIYGDLTLIYNTGTYRPLEWTYPDYGGDDIIALFNRWRGFLKAKLKGFGGSEIQAAKP